MKIDKIHIYVCLRFSREEGVPSLQKGFREILEKQHFREELYPGRMELLFHSILLPSKATDLIQLYQELLSVLERLYAESDEDLPDLRHVSMVGSVQHLPTQEEPSIDQLPGWVLSEFGSALILDAPVHEIQKNREKFKLLDREHRLFTWMPEVGVFRVRGNSEKQLRKMRNIGHHVPAQTTIVENISIRDLSRLAEAAYADVEVTEQIGGRALLLSFSIERNPHVIDEEKRTFTFYNATALGLRYQVLPNSLVDHIQRGTVRILKVVAEPQENGGMNNEF